MLRRLINADSVGILGGGRVKFIGDHLTINNQKDSYSRQPAVKAPPLCLAVHQVAFSQPSNIHYSYRVRNVQSGEEEAQ